MDDNVQGAFRLRVLRAYDGQCAITGEHTAPVLDAAHIQPYLGPRSNHVQDGMILIKESYALQRQPAPPGVSRHQLKMATQAPALIV